MSVENQKLNLKFRLSTSGVLESKKRVKAQRTIKFDFQSTEMSLFSWWKKWYTFRVVIFVYQSESMSDVLIDWFSSYIIWYTNRLIIMYETFDLIIFSVIRVTSYASPRLQNEKNKIELISKLCQKHESDWIKRFNGIIYTVY